jgi:hypothetical protein
MMGIVPTTDMKFTTKGELSVFMLIYNPKVDAMNKPRRDGRVTSIEAEQRAGSSSARRARSAERPTLPPAFDMSPGATADRSAVPRWRRFRRAITGSKSRSPKQLSRNL